MFRLIFISVIFAFSGAALTACSTINSQNAKSDSDPGTDVTASDSDSERTDGSDSTPDMSSDPGALSLLPPKEAAILADVQSELEASADLTASELQATWPSQQNARLDYDPLNAQNLDTIQASAYTLTDAELSTLAENGFVISKRLSGGTFFGGYAGIYEQHLPVYISADALLDAVHRSYDAILMAFEEQILVSELDTLLQSLRNALPGITGITDDVRADLDLYLTVAHSLLLLDTQTGTFADDADISKIVRNALAADGLDEMKIFGSARTVDYSQFTPRGHYVDSPSLKPYFRAMMWLGRIDFRMVETNSDGTQTVNRRQLEAVLALGEALATEQARWSGINQVIELFVGESDNMTPLQIDALRDALGITATRELDDLSDSQIARAILTNGFGAQRIASHIMVNGMTSGTLPLNASFLIFGQRFTPDSEVFSNVVYDRVQGGDVRRMMPNPLDVGFAVMKNNQAAALLQTELDKYEYAPDLHMMRTLVDTYDDEFWRSSLYTLWLSSLRNLSADKSDMPTYTQTAQWQTRMLNTQLGSWAQLRHDTLLYAKQSMTGIPSCEYPEAYVDPYPEFFDALNQYARKGNAVISGYTDDRYSWIMDMASAYFTNLETASDILAEMAQQELDGIPFTETQLGFVNDAIMIKFDTEGCAAVEIPSGWYARLFFDSLSALESDPTIADVHTQPADELGNIVGKVLHVATGDPRTMVVSVNQCDGPRAYVGMVFAYHEKITTDFQRMTDQEWAQEISETAAADVPWLQSLIAN